jgi:hypothetical protein
MEEMREIIEAELENTDALNCIYGKIPSEAWDDLVDLVIQKMNWAYRRGFDDAIPRAE